MAPAVLAKTPPPPLVSSIGSFLPGSAHQQPQMSTARGKTIQPVVIEIFGGSKDFILRASDVCIFFWVSLRVI